MNDPGLTYQECIADVDAISALIDHDAAKARSLLMDTKTKWISIMRCHKGTELERVVRNTMPCLPKANTAPASWTEELFEARDAFTFAKSQLP